jgi:transposase
MNYPPAVLEKAQRLEQLLLRVAAGEPLDAVNAALGFHLDPSQLAHWQAKYEAGGCKREALIDGRHGHPRKAHSALREWLYVRKEQDEEVRAPQLATEIEEKFEVELSAGHINYLLRKRGLTAPPGRPYKQGPSADEDAAPSDSPPSTPVDNAGVFFPRSCEDGNGSGRGG